MMNFEIEQIKQQWEGRGKIEIWRIFVLAYMARNDIYPDGTFGDDECCIWEAFRRKN